MSRVSSVTVFLLFIIICVINSQEKESDCPEFDRNLCKESSIYENQDVNQCKSDCDCENGHKCCNHCKYEYKVCTEVIEKEYPSNQDKYLKNKCCPEVKPCFTPLKYNAKYRCGSDEVCPFGYKCCRSDCYIHKVCVTPIDKEGNKIVPPSTTTISTTAETKTSTFKISTIVTTSPTTKFHETTILLSTPSPDESSGFGSGYTDDDKDGDKEESPSITTSSHYTTISLSTATTTSKKPFTIMQETTQGFTEASGEFTDDDDSDDDRDDNGSGDNENVETGQPITTSSHQTTISPSSDTAITKEASIIIQEATKRSTEFISSTEGFTGDGDGGNDKDGNGSGDDLTETKRPTTISSHKTTISLTTVASSDKETSTTIQATTRKFTESSSSSDDVTVTRSSITASNQTASPISNSFSRIQETTRKLTEFSASGEGFTDDDDSGDGDDIGSGDGEQIKTLQPITTTLLFHTNLTAVSEYSTVATTKDKQNTTFLETTPEDIFTDDDGDGNDNGSGDNDKLETSQPFTSSPLHQNLSTITSNSQFSEDSAISTKLPETPLTASTQLTYKSTKMHPTSIVGNVQGGGVTENKSISTGTSAPTNVSTPLTTISVLQEKPHVNFGSPTITSSPALNVEGSGDSDDEYVSSIPPKISSSTTGKSEGSDISDDRSTIGSQKRSTVNQSSSFTLITETDFEFYDENNSTITFTTAHQEAKLSSISSTIIPETTDIDEGSGSSDDEDFLSFSTSGSPTIKIIQQTQAKPESPDVSAFDNTITTTKQIYETKTIAFSTINQETVQASTINSNRTQITVTIEPNISDTRTTVAVNYEDKINTTVSTDSMAHQTSKVSSSNASLMDIDEGSGDSDDEDISSSSTIISIVTNTSTTQELRQTTEPSSVNTTISSSKNGLELSSAENVVGNTSTLPFTNDFEYDDDDANFTTTEQQEASKSETKILTSTIPSGFTVVDNGSKSSAADINAQKNENNMTANGFTYEENFTSSTTHTKDLPPDAIPDIVEDISNSGDESKLKDNGTIDENLQDELGVTSVVSNENISTSAMTGQVSTSGKPNGLNNLTENSTFITILPLSATSSEKSIRNLSILLGETTDSLEQGSAYNPDDFNGDHDDDGDDVDEDIRSNFNKPFPNNA